METMLSKCIRKANLLASIKGRESGARFVRLSLLVCLFLSAGTCWAANSRDWTGADDGYWGDPNNWSPYGTPEVGDTLRFGYVSSSRHTMTNDLTGVKAAELDFNNASYEIDGNALEVTYLIQAGNLDTELVSQSYNVTFNCPLNFNQDVIVTDAGGTEGIFSESIGDLYFNGPIQINGHARLMLYSFAGSLDSGGYGRIHVAGAISGTGSLYLIPEEDSGEIATIEFLGTAINTLTGTIYVGPPPDGYGEPGGRVILNKPLGAVTYHTLAFVTGGTANLVSPSDYPQMLADANLLIGFGSTVNLSGALTTATLTLTNKHDDAVGSTLNASIITLTKALVSSIDSDTIYPSINGTMILNNPIPVTTVNPGGVGALNIAANILGSGINKYGNSILYLSGTNQFYGGTRVYEGTLQPMASNALGVENHGIWLYGGKLQMQDISIPNETLTIASSNTAVVAYNRCVWGGLVVLNSDLNLSAIDLTSSGLATTFSGAISGSGGFNSLPAIFENATVELAGNSANTFTGPLHNYNNLLELNKTAGVKVCGGPLIVGQPNDSHASEVRWLNSNQDNEGAITLYNNGRVSLNNFNEIFGALNFNGGAVGSGSGHATLNGPVTVNAQDFSSLISGNLILSPTGNAVFNVSSTGADGNLQVPANISGSAQYLVKQGPGELILAGANTFSSVQLLESGTIIAESSGALSTTPIVIFNDATLAFAVSGTFNQGIELYGDGSGLAGNDSHLGVGAVQIYPGNSVTLTGNLLQDAETTYFVDQGGLLQLGGVISGSGPLTKTGTGNLILFGNSPNTYSGDTLAKEGTLTLAKPGSTKSVPGNLVIGTRSSSLNNLGTTATLVDDNFYNVTGPTVTVNGGSLLNINGANERFTGIYLNNGGSVQTGSGSVGLDGSSPANGIFVSAGQNGASVISGNLYFYNGGNANFGVSPRNSALPNAAPELDVQAVISSPTVGYFVKSGGGTMTLDTANTLVSTVTINDGRLTLKNSTALGTSYSSVNINSNGVLALDGGLRIANRVLELNSTNAQGALRTLSGSNVWVAYASLNRTATMNVQPASGYLDFLDSIEGPGGITTVGSGTVKFEGTNANSYTGLTTVSSGVVEASRSTVTITSDPRTGRLKTNTVGVVCIPGDAVIGNDSSSGTAAILRSDRLTQFSFSANYALYSSGLIDLPSTTGVNGARESAKSLTGAGMVNLGVNSSFYINNTDISTFNGTVSGAGTFIKEGTGTLVTYGNINSSHNVDVIGGDWKIFGGRQGGGVDVSNGGLRGDGTVDGVVTVTGGEVAVDSHYPDRHGSTLHLGSLTAISGVTLELKLYGPSPTGGNDQIATTAGGVSLASDTVLSTAFSYPPREGDVLDLVSVSGGTITGKFQNFPDGIIQLVGKTPVFPSYHGGSGNDFTLTVTNLALTYAGYQLAEGNGNQTVEPDECNLLYVSLINRRSTALTITNAYLRATNPIGAVVTLPMASYPVIPAGQTAANSTPFQFKTDTNLACGGTVGFELVVGVLNEGEFAMDFNPLSGTDCSHPTGPCDSCTAASGHLGAGSLMTTQPLYFVGAPSLAYPPKGYPGTNPAPFVIPVPYAVHNFTNTTTNVVCVTAELNFACGANQTNALGVAAYLGSFDTNNPAIGYLGDIGQGGPPYPAFSFQVPPNTNFTMVVMAQVTNLVCGDYTLQLYGLPCPPPKLAIEADAAPRKLKIDWSTAYPGWTVQQTGTAGSGYTNVIGAPTIVDGRYAITNVTPVTNEFYRLKK